MSLSAESQTDYEADTIGFASSSVELTEDGSGEYTGQFTDNFGNVVTIYIPEDGSDGSYTVLYPQGTEAYGTIPASSITVDKSVNGNVTTIAEHVDLLAAAVSGQYETSLPVAEQITATSDPNVKNVYYSFIDAKTGDTIVVTGTITGDPVYQLTYKDIQTGQEGTVTYSHTADGVDNYITAVTNPVAPTAAPTSAPSAPAATPGSLPQTGAADANASGLAVWGTAVLGGALALGALKKRRDTEEKED